MTIVIVAFNRVKELSMLLESLAKANYYNDNIDLVISIDYGGSELVSELAKSFNWKYGKKEVIEHKENLGLRNHVLFCGDLTRTLGDIILLEDDLFVSPEFYHFSKEALEYYRNDRNVAGISLYTYNINEYTKLRPFKYISDESDIYFVKVPSSWGQAWTKEQWDGFRIWYKENLSLKDFIGKVPDKVLSWSDKSWKKYFAVYLATSNKYFVYPKVALSTNMGAQGTHNTMIMNNYQAELMNSFERGYLFKQSLDKSSIKYDAFFESENLKDFLEQSFHNVIIDYYGTKKDYSNCNYLLSTTNMNYEIVREWDLALKPYELNVLYDLKGTGLYLYNLHNTKPNKNKIFETELIKYEIPYITKERALKICFEDYTSAFLRKMKKICKIK